MEQSKAFEANDDRLLSIAARLLALVARQLRHGCARPPLWIAAGVLHRALGQWDHAADAFLKALQLSPGNRQARAYLGMIRLTQGRFAEGWRDYRSRWGGMQWTDRMRHPPASLWDGSMHPRLRLLLWCEQGYGDALQFVRYVPWLRSLGLHVALEAPAPLLPLFAANWPGLPLFPQGQVQGRFDAHLPLMDLPAVWRGPLLAQPQGVPYLRAAPARPETGMPQVGIAWAGRPTHPDDAIRSMAPDLLEPLWACPGVAWIGLQKDTTDLPAAVRDGVAQVNDFLRLAELVAGIDLVITVDTAVAHLAGALGKPVWLMLPYVPDWRWMLEHENTPWYPTMRLFRQGRRNDWQGVVHRVAAALHQWKAGAHA